MKKALILFSGGADSALLVVLAKKLGREISLVCFDYGQKHSDEINYAANLATELAGKFLFGEGPCLVTLNLRGAFSHTGSNLLHNSSADYPGVHSMHVPGRNTVFLGVALSYAESRNMDEVWIGCDYSDACNLFPDCTQEYLLAMQEVYNLGSSATIEIKAPLLGLSKEDVKTLLVAEGVDLDKVYSGYEPPARTTPGPETIPPGTLWWCGRCQAHVESTREVPHVCRRTLQGPSGAPGSTPAPIPAPRTYPNDPEAPRRSGSFSPNTTD